LNNVRRNQKQSWDSSAARFTSRVTNVFVAQQRRRYLGQRRLSLEDSRGQCIESEKHRKNELNLSRSCSLDQGNDSGEHNHGSLLFKQLDPSLLPACQTRWSGRNRCRIVTNT